jgi:hypothetical protein
VKSHHRKMRFVDEPAVVHYTWFALGETFCGVARDLGARPLRQWGLTSNHVTCVACTALMSVVEEAWQALPALTDEEPGMNGISSDNELAMVRRARLPR